MIRYNKIHLASPGNTVFPLFLLLPVSIMLIKIIEVVKKPKPSLFFDGWCEDKMEVSAARIGPGLTPGSIL